MVAEVILYKTRIESKISYMSSMKSGKIFVMVNFRKHTSDICNI